MSDRTNTTCPLAVGCAKYVSALRRLSLASDVSALDQFFNESLHFKALADNASTGSFSSIIAAIETLLRKELEPGKLLLRWNERCWNLLRTGSNNWPDCTLKLCRTSCLVRELLYTFDW